MTTGIIAIAAGLAIGLAAIGIAIGQGILASKAMESMGNPRVDDHRDGHYGNHRRIDLRHRHRVGRQDLIGAGERRAE